MYRGRDSVIALFERILETWEYMRPEPREHPSSSASGALSRQGRAACQALAPVTIGDPCPPTSSTSRSRDGLVVNGQMSQRRRSCLAVTTAVDLVHQVNEAFRDRDFVRSRTADASSTRVWEFTIHGSRLSGGGRPTTARAASSSYFERPGRRVRRHAHQRRPSITSRSRTVVCPDLPGRAARGKRSGPPIDEEIASVWSIRDGKILTARKVHLDPDGGASLSVE